MQVCFVQIIKNFNTANCAFQLIKNNCLLTRPIKPYKEGNCYNQKEIKKRGVRFFRFFNVDIYHILIRGRNGGLLLGKGKIIRIRIYC